jgi:hypothetical protein
MKTHQCDEPGTSVSTALMYSGDGGLSTDGELVRGGGDPALIVERAKDKEKQNELWMLNSCIREMERRASSSGDWQKYAPTITHLMEYQRGLREELNGNG